MILENKATKILLRQWFKNTRIIMWRWRSAKAIMSRLSSSGQTAASWNWSGTMVSCVRSQRILDHEWGPFCKRWQGRLVSFLISTGETRLQMNSVSVVCFFHRLTCVFRWRPGVLVATDQPSKHCPAWKVRLHQRVWYENRENALQPILLRRLPAGIFQRRLLH